MGSTILKNEFNNMKKCYENKPLIDIHLKVPAWLPVMDPMYDMYTKKRYLLQYGKLTYANIVQANEILFRRFPMCDCPANLVYSTDPYVIENPDILSEIAAKLYGYKHTPVEQIPCEWKEIAKVLADEYDRSDFTFSLEFDSHLIEFHMIPTIIHRKLLPKNRLCGSLLPILAVPEYRQIMILPKRYWSKHFTKLWTMGII